MSRSPLSARVAIECIDQALVLGKRHFWSLLRLGLIPFHRDSLCGANCQRRREFGSWCELCPESVTGPAISLGRAAGGWRILACCRRRCCADSSSSDATGRPPPVGFSSPLLVHLGRGRRPVSRSAGRSHIPGNSGEERGI